MIPTTYINHPTFDNSSKAEVMITAVRTYLDISIIKSEIFSQTEPLLIFSSLIAKIVIYSMQAKLEGLN